MAVQSGHNYVREIIDNTDLQYIKLSDNLHTSIINADYALS